MTFKALGLLPTLVDALHGSGFKKPTPIQEKAIPAILKNKDVLGIAQTGSGKTASFVLPILMHLQRNALTKSRDVNVLVLVPTRELAVQVNDVFKTFGATLPDAPKSMAVFGGVSINPQMKALYGTHILVATPGRLLELVDSKAVHLGNIEILVLDEADKMLNLGFEEEMKRIFSLLSQKRQNLLFSATLTDKVEEITQLLLHNPQVIKIESEQENLDLIKQLAYFVADDKKGILLRHLLKNEAMNQVLIFTSSVYKADHVADKLKKNGIDAKATHSKKSQGSRKETLRAFKAGQLRILVTTDLLSRGIDIAFLPYVINYDLPRSPKDFVHRIGRTGRADNPGEAITFVSPEEEHHFKVTQKKMGKWVTRIKFDNLDLG